MADKKHLRLIGVGLVALLIVFLLISDVGSAPNTPVTVMGYEDLIFKTDRIHRIDIHIDDWAGFLETCMDGTYSICSVTINGEQLDNVGLRAMENASLPGTDSGRYSLTLEFDHYDSGQTYHQLDKLDLNNLFQDNTMMKDHLTYRLMRQIGVAAPLCSYATIYVNGRSLGLYLAVEAMEESFLQRHYGTDYGKLYAPRDGKLQYIDDNPESYRNIFDNAKTPVTPEDEARLIQALKQLNTGKKLKNVVDIEAVIRYFMVHNFVCSDTGASADHYYLYEKDGKLSMLPGDYQLAFGGISMDDASAGASIYTPVSGESVKSRPMLSWILESKKYTWLYRRYFIELLYVDMEALVEQTEKMIAPYVLRDPSRLCTYEEFETGVQTLKEFLELRSESVRKQLWSKNTTVDAGDLDLSKMGGISTTHPN